MTIFVPNLNLKSFQIDKKGFQVIYIRCVATDNQAIIPNLKFGFLISGIELTDDYGVLLRLSYYFNEVRRKTMHVRSSLQQPDDDVTKIIRRYE